MLLAEAGEYLGNLAEQVVTVSAAHLVHVTAVPALDFAAAGRRKQPCSRIYCRGEDPFVNFSGTAFARACLTA